MIKNFAFILTIFVVGSSVSQVLIQTERNCVKDDQYCQNHWECCSNSCLSFSYRCVSNGLPENVEETTRDRGTLQVLVDGLFASTERPANYDVPPANLDDLVNRFGGGESTSTSTSTIATGAAGTGSVSDCKVNGMKCLRDKECCTQRCHGFLHQCVT